MQKRHFSLRELVPARRPADRASLPPPLLPISESAFLGYVKQGHFPSPKRAGRRVYWLATDVEQILEILDSGRLEGISVHAEEPEPLAAEA